VLHIRIRIIVKVGSGSANSMRIRNSAADAHPGAAEVQNGAGETRLGAEKALCETVEAPPGAPESLKASVAVASFGLDPDPRQSTKKSYTDSLIRICIKVKTRFRIRVNHATLNNA
jgi:hypothetical protein